MWSSMDILSREQRSKLMSKVRARGNRSTERKLRYSFVRNALSGWVLHPTIEGRPDFLFTKQRLVIFVDGCFWHHCPKCLRPLPKGNARYWSGKIRSNVLRRNKVARQLRRRGYGILRVWEHELRDHGVRDVVARIGQALRKH